MLWDYEGKKFANVSSESTDLDTEEEKEELKKVNENAKDLLSFMNDSIESGWDIIYRIYF